MDSKLKSIQRETYGVLEWLGDIGGLAEFLTLFCRILPSILGGIRIKALLTNHLFHISVDDSNHIYS